MLVPAPTSETELLQRATQLAGLSLTSIAQGLDITVPPDLRRDKGWVGQLLELALGATAKNKAVPDFEILGIELKTIPLNSAQQPQESTFVSTIPLLKISQMTWETSVVRKKLRHVLWMPIQADANIALAERCIGMPLLWRPSVEQEAILKQDWDELTDKIAMGQLEQISAHQGQYLQVRPKGANAKSLCWGIGPEGEKVLTLPRGFYLRPSFTRVLLEGYYCY